MVCVIIAARIFNNNPDCNYSIDVDEQQDANSNNALTAQEGVKAWSPLILIFLLLMLTSTL